MIINNCWWVHFLGRHTLKWCVNEIILYLISLKARENMFINWKFLLQTMFDHFEWVRRQRENKLFKWIIFLAASSKKPSITHEDVNSIFLNRFINKKNRFIFHWNEQSLSFSEIILFLHQIFYKGLSKKLENWPTFYTGDLFDMFISMLHIYLEYVRNHHYSLQVNTIIFIFLNKSIFSRI